MGHVIQSRVRRLTLLNLEIFRLKEEDNTRTTFDLKFFSKFSRKKNRVILLKELKPSSYRKMIKSPPFDNLSPSLRHFR